jgi:hypothetical protein
VECECEKKGATVAIVVSGLCTADRRSVTASRRAGDGAAAAAEEKHEASGGEKNGRRRVGGEVEVYSSWQREGAAWVGAELACGR